MPYLWKLLIFIIPLSNNRCKTILKRKKRTLMVLVDTKTWYKKLVDHFFVLDTKRLFCS